MHCFANSTESDPACAIINNIKHNGSVYTGLNITNAVQPGLTGPANWSYIPADQLSAQVPLTKPLSIECPIPVCLYGVTGFYSPCQRYLFYVNILLMFIAGRIPILRGVAAIYVMAVYFVSSIVLWSLSIVELSTHSTPPTTNMDRYPAQEMLSWGLILFSLWLLNRHGIKGTLVFTTNPLAGCKSSSGVYVFNPEGLRDKQSYKQSLAISIGAVIFIAYWINAYILVVLIYTKSDTLPTVLLSSDTEYRIAAPCYQDPLSGIATLWSDSKSEPFRVLNELVQQVPSIAADAKVSLNTIHAASVNIQRPVPYLPSWICIPVFLASMLVISCIFRFVTWMWFRDCDRDKRWKIFTWLANHAGIGAGLYVTIPLELGFRDNHTPQAEQFFQLGQWGPWAIGIIVLVAAIAYKTLGLDDHSDNASRTFVTPSDWKLFPGAQDREEGKQEQDSRPLIAPSPSSDTSLVPDGSNDSVYGEMLEHVHSNWLDETVLMV